MPGVVVEFCVLVALVAEAAPLRVGLRVYVDEVIEGHKAYGTEVLEVVLGPFTAKAEGVNAFVVPASCEMWRKRVEVKILKGDSFARTDSPLRFLGIFWGEQIEGTAIISSSVLVPQSPGCSMLHSLGLGHALEIRGVLSPHID